jgi:hypothetical protein
MAKQKEIIYDSAPSQPDDDFWLEQGRKMLGESYGAARKAAKTLMRGLGMLNAVYLGILGFAKLVPEYASFVQKSVFVTPLVFWLLALYFSLEVMMTKQLSINLHSPDDIRKNSEEVLKEKQRHLYWALGALAVGLAIALLLLVFRINMQAN